MPKLTPVQSAASAPRALVIGAGPMASFMHLPILSTLQRAGRVDLRAICDLDSVRASDARGKFGFAEQCGDAARAIERSDIDLVYIFADARIHYEYGMLALSRGKHLFVEKPVAPSYAEARQLSDRAQQQQVIAVGGHNRRFYPSIVEARRRAGLAGWHFAEAVFHKPVQGRSPDFAAATWLSANGIHALDALVFLMGGLPEHVTAQTDREANSPPHCFSAVMRWQNSGQGVFLCNNGAGARREEYVLHAAGETCTLSETEFCLDRDGRSERRRLAGGRTSFEAEHAAFLDGVRTGVAPPHSLGDLAPSLFLGELIERGFSGPVVLPPTMAAERAVEGSAAPGRSVLVVGGRTLFPALTRLLPKYGLVTPEELAPSPTGNRQIVAAIMGRGAAPLTDEILARLPCLEVVGVVGLSVARYDPEGMQQRGIALLNARASHAASVAEFALGLAILARRRAFVSHDVMRSGGWGVRPAPRGFEAVARSVWRTVRPLLKSVHRTRLTAYAKALLPATQDGRAATVHDLSTSVVGIIGWGANAQAFAACLRPLGARVIVHSEHAPATEIEAAGAVPAPLGAVLAADIVSLHRGLTARTRHGLGAAELERLRPGSVLINLARGALIEPDALLSRLRRGDIFACLDTFDEEPLPAAHPLRRLPNVFLTSHIAGGSPDMQAASAREVVDKVIAFLEGQEVETLSPDLLRNMT
jgi:phosphoglycerate dehydrogenase-like enzyme/predicted dehydrogenase